MAFKINGINYPAADRINGRTTTLNRSMANTLMHRISCSPEVEAQWVQFFPNKTCAYCGNAATHLDHLYPLIDGKRPTGYGTDPGNLVPCCTKCNQPKGKENWEVFMRSNRCKHIRSVKNSDPVLAMEERIQIIKDFQNAIPAQKVTIDHAIMAEWDKLVVDFETILKKVEQSVNALSEQLYAGLSPSNSVKRKSSTKAKTSTPPRSSRKGTSADTTYEIAAYYLRNQEGMSTVGTKFLPTPDPKGSKTKSRLKPIGVLGEYKGLLIHTSIDDAITNAVDPVFKNTLEEIKKRGL